MLPLAQPTDIVPEDLPLSVVYEDDDVLVVNKAAGMVVHPPPATPPARWSTRCFAIRT